MPLDSNRVYRPDFQADSILPSWIPMGDEGGSQGVGSGFVDALKSRMAAKPQAGIAGGTGYTAAMPTSNTQALGHEGLHSLPTKGVGSTKGGGGMSSL